MVDIPPTRFRTFTFTIGIHGLSKKVSDQTVTPSGLGEMSERQHGSCIAYLKNHRKKLKNNKTGGANNIMLTDDIASLIHTEPSRPRANRKTKRYQCKKSMPQIRNESDEENAANPAKKANCCPDRPCKNNGNWFDGTRHFIISTAGVAIAKAIPHPTTYMIKSPALST